MDKCRICLQYKKKLCSLFEKDHGISYADMITSVAKVKIVKGAYNNWICLQCRRKLQSLHNFKTEIERSDVELNQHLKILRFDNINDVKAEISVMKEIEDKGNNITTHKDISCISLLQSGCTFYGNTTISKIVSHSNCVEKTNKAILNPGRIKYETNDDYVYLYENYSTRDYNFLRRMQARKMYRKENDKGSTKTKKYISNSKNVCLKPIVLNNIRVIPSRRKPHKLQKEHKRRKRLDMCPYCGIMSSSMKSHIMVHIGEKNFKCSECNKAFFTSHQLSYHQSSHLMAGTFKCDHCVAVFNSKTSLQSHMVSHTGDKSHICSACNKGFKRKNALRRHMLIHSSSAKSVKCDLCNMSFLYKQGLRHHMRVHTGERPFRCEICSQPYSYKHDFNRHCLKKHGVFLKQRSVHVMNEEVLMQERELMKDLMLRIRGVVKDGEPMNPFQGPHAALAFDQAVKALGSCQIPIDVML